MVCFCLSVTQAIGAVVIDTTVNMPASSTAFGSVGERTIEACGQTFTVPHDNSVLTDFAFRVSDDTIFIFSQQFPGVTRFAFAVAEWNSATNTIRGPLLFESDEHYTVPTIPQGNDFNFQFEWYTFDTGRLNLTPGGQYVAFITTLSEGVKDNVADLAFVELLQTPNFEGGTHVYLAFSSIRPQWYEDWSNVVWTQSLDGVVNDTSFRATFVAVPEPTVLMLASGAAVLALRRRT